jgi:opacity protein-like surface antigen
MFLAVGVGGIFVPNAQAQWYASGNVGATFLNDSDFTDTFTGGAVAGEIGADTGYGISGALGYSWGNFGLEGEVSYRKNDLDDVSVNTLSIAGLLFTGLGTFSLDGETTALGFMANGWYNFATPGPWVPFIGAGIGVANISLDLDNIGGVAVSYDESDTVFAYQVGAGVGYKVTPKTMVNLSYRYFATHDPEFSDGVDNVETEYSTHNVMLGVTVRF